LFLESEIHYANFYASSSSSSTLFFVILLTQPKTGSTAAPKEKEIGKREKLKEPEALFVPMTSSIQRSPRSLGKFVCFTLDDLLLNPAGRSGTIKINANVNIGSREQERRETKRRE